MHGNRSVDGTASVTVTGARRRVRNIVARAEGGGEGWWALYNACCVLHGPTQHVRGGPGDVRRAALDIDVIVKYDVDWRE